MQLRKLLFVIGWLLILGTIFVSCPVDPPARIPLVPEIPRNPQIMDKDGVPANGRVVDYQPGYEKYWSLGGIVEVDLKVEDGYISEVYIFLSHEDLFLCSIINENWGFNEINGPGWMVEQNTVELDVVAGATYTSIAVLETAARALEHIINHTQPEPTITLDREFLILTAESSGTITASTKYINEDSPLVWSSSNTSIARVSNGTVTAQTLNGIAIIQVIYTELYQDEEGNDQTRMYSADCLVIVHGGEEPEVGTRPDPGDQHGMVQGRSVAIRGRFDPRAAEDTGPNNIFLVEDSGYLAMGKNILGSSEEGGTPNISTWHIMTRHDDPTKVGLKNFHSGLYLNAKGVARGTDDTSLPVSQPRVSSFEDSDDFYWHIVDAPGGGFNIVSRGTLRTAADTGNSRAGAISNRAFNFVDQPQLWLYPLSQAGGDFLSEPCFMVFPFQHVQWRLDADWLNALGDDAFVFDIWDQ